MHAFGRGAFVLCVLTLMGNTCLANEKPLSVCEVLSSLDHYRGKFIIVRGILGGGNRHGRYLQNDVEGKPCYAFAHQGRKWPSAIAVSQYSRGSEIEDGAASFESDSAHIRDMLSEPERVVGNREDAAIEITAIGELRSRKGIVVTRSEDGSYVGNAYAQAGQYPALLVLKTITAAEVVKRGRSGTR